MKRVILLSLICLLGAVNSQAQMEKFLVNKYWQYSQTMNHQEKGQVYNFRAIPRDSIQEIAMYFDAQGGFKEVVTKAHPKPARTGRWRFEKDVLVIDFAAGAKTPGWKYKIHYIDAAQFQCTTVK